MQTSQTGLGLTSRTGLVTQMRGKPADPQIYLKATCLQDPELEAHLVKFDHLISYVDRGTNITRLKTTPTVAQALAVFLFGGLRQLSATLQLLISSSG